MSILILVIFDAWYSLISTCWPFQRPIYFSSFDHIVRKQLDPVWNKVGSSTKALVRDLGVLRRLVGYLLTY